MKLARLNKNKSKTTHQNVSADKILAFSLGFDNFLYFAPESMLLSYPRNKNKIKKRNK